MEFLSALEEAVPTAPPAPAAPPAPSRAPDREPSPRPEDLGDAGYRADHGLRLAYCAGAMVKGIASEELVIRMGRAGLLGFFGTGGLRLDRIGAAIARIQSALGPDRPYGMNLLCNTVRPRMEEETVDLFLKAGVRLVEASAFMTLTRALVRYRLTGARRLPDGRAFAPNRIQAKVSRPEVARAFLRPAPADLAAKLASDGLLTASEAALAPEIPVAQDLCVEADSGGHTDNGNPFCLLPAMLRLRDEARAAFSGRQALRIGAAGGIGTPEAAAAAFVMGADFIVTGSINQCTVEAGTSDLVKDLLARASIQDTGMAPAGDMFELGAEVQVLRKGLLFPARAAKLYEVYRQAASWEEVDAAAREQIERKIFRKPFAEAEAETRAYLASEDPEALAQMDASPKARMARVFRWYFGLSNRLALQGDAARKEDFQVHCGPAMGAFNAWAKGTPLEDWRARHADALADALMAGACAILARPRGGAAR